MMRERFKGENNPFYGKTHSNKSLKKMSDKHKDMTLETRERIRKSRIGTHLRVETREKLRTCNIGKKRTLESRKKMSKAQEGNKKWLGKTHSDETKERLRILQYGRKYTPESCEKMSRVHIGLQAKENHPNWKGGITPLTGLIRRCKEYELWRESVFKRDGYRDWFSGMLCENNITAHHIIPFSALIEKYQIKTFEQAIDCKELWDINNGVTMSEYNHFAYHSMWGISGIGDLNGN
jgi:hypothetical protein